MKQTSQVQCPKCKKSQEDNIYDLVDAGDVEGSFEMECGHCETVFLVKYAFKPFVETME